MPACHCLPSDRSSFDLRDYYAIRSSKIAALTSRNALDWGRYGSASASARHAMQPPKIKLFDRLDGDKLHGRTQHRLGNRFRVAEVVLLSLQIRPDIPGRHQPRIMAERLELPTR